MAGSMYCDPILVDEGNKFAWSLARAVMQQPGEYGLLHIYGASGVGKTQMLRWIEHEVQSDSPNLNVLYTTADEVRGQMTQAFIQHNRGSFMEKYQRVNLLLIDDLHSIAGLEATQEEFARLFEALYIQRKQVITASVCPERELVALDGYLQRHLGGILSAEIREPGPEVRHAIVERECRRMGLELTENVCSYLVNQAHNPFRIIGLVRRVAAYHDLQKMPLDDIDHVKACLKAILSGEGEKS